MQKGSLAIIIVNYNESRFAIELLKNDGFRHADEIIFVDGNSTDCDIQKLISCIGNDKVKLIKNDGKQSVFGAFYKGCCIAESEYVACWSMDDYPENNYSLKMKVMINTYPIVDLFSCNSRVVREGTFYDRTLFHEDSYISPDYAVKIFKNGYARQLNLIGSVIKKECIFNAWENGGQNLDVNFDGMYFFHAVFNKGFINIGQNLVTYRSYPNGFGAKSNHKAMAKALKIHYNYYKHDKQIFERAIESGIWSNKSQWSSHIALWLIKTMPKFLRLMFYKWFYNYDWRIEKL